MAHTTCDRADKWVPTDTVPIARYTGDETRVRMADVSPVYIPLETSRLRNQEMTAVCTSCPSRDRGNDVCMGFL